MGAVKEEAEKLKAQIAEHKKRLMEEKGLSQRRPRRTPSWPSWSRRTTRSARSQALECLFRPMLNLMLTRRCCSCTVSLCENVLPPSGPHNVECGRRMCSCPHDVSPFTALGKTSSTASSRFFLCALFVPPFVPPWARQQTQKLAGLTQQSTNLSPSERKEVEELVTEMVELKARFGAEGLTRHDQEKHDDMQRCMWRLRELRQKDHRDKKHDGRQQPEAKAVKEEAEKLKAQIAEHKKRLMEEKGLSQKEAKEDAVLAELEQTYNAICQVAGA